MATPTNSFNPSSANNHLHAAFLLILPRIEAHGHVCFRDVKCADRKQDFIAEMVALGWKWFLRLVAKGKDPLDFPSALATYAARAVKAGRRLTGQERSKDVMSPVAKRKHGVKVESLPSSTRRCYDDLFTAVRGQQSVDSYEERLHDNSVTPPPDAAAFRIDWPAFLATLTERDRELAHFLSLGHAASKAAEQFKLTPGRVTQLRQRWCREWRLCQGEEDAVRQGPAARA
jgi:hypothetical protein